MDCETCGKESPNEFNFCPHCGKTFVAGSSVDESPVSAQDAKPAIGIPSDQTAPARGGLGGTALRAGTLIFGAFAAISLVVSISKGLVPIYLLEAALWAGAAWYWQAKKTHGEVAKGIVAILALLVAIGETAHIVIQADSTSQPQPPTAYALLFGAPQDKPRPEPLPPCPSGIRAGAKIAEIAPDQVEGSDGQLWYIAPDRETGEKGGWYFHFTVINHAKDFCLTAIEYEVDLESDGGAILKGHGKKHIDTLSPEWKYTPHEKDPDDSVTFAVKSTKGALSTWRITGAYGFPQTVSVPR